MGDSFSSGVGANYQKDSPTLSSLGSSTVGSSTYGYDPGTVTEDNKCFRSDGSYGPIAARDLGYELDFIACSGAKITEMLSVAPYSEPIQIEALSADTDIVVLTAGGNDVGFVEYVACVALEECTEHSPAASRIHSESNIALPGLMDQLLLAIKLKAPHARIVVMGYVIGLDPVESISAVPGGVCFPYLSKAEMELTYRIRDNLNGSLQEAAVRNRAEFIDPHAPGSILNSWGQVYATPLGSLLATACLMISSLRFK